MFHSGLISFCYVPYEADNGNEIILFILRRNCHIFVVKLQSCNSDRYLSPPQDFSLTAIMWHSLLKINIIISFPLVSSYGT